MGRRLTRRIFPDASANVRCANRVLSDLCREYNSRVLRCAIGGAEIFLLLCGMKGFCWMDR
jgi:hypothetical protein